MHDDGGKVRKFLCHATANFLPNPTMQVPRQLDGIFYFIVISLIDIRLSLPDFLVRRNCRGIISNV